MGLIILSILFAVGNKDFMDTADMQLKAGFKGHALPECRQVTEGIPAITIDTVQGKKVCYKLALTVDGAK